MSVTYPVTPEDIANVCKLLERLRTGEMNLIPALANIGQRKEDASTAMLKRVESVLSNHLRRMQEPLDDGGPAFPRDHAHDGHNGMSLRDYFAAALPDEPQANDGDYSDQFKAALLGRQCPSIREHGAVAVLEFEAEFRARWRYLRADAMLKARQT